MGDTPTFENSAAETANKVLRFGMDLAVAAAEIAIKAEAPYLAWPVVSQIVDAILGRFGDLLYRFFAEHATLAVIDFQTMEEKKAYFASVDALKKAKSSGDQHAIDSATQKLRDDMARLIHWDGSATP